MTDAAQGPSPGQSPSSAPQSGGLRLPAILTFSLANLPISALGVALAIYLKPYIATHLGVGLTMVGVAWFAARMIDMPIDPLLGVFMDRTRTPLGRYRVWMMAGAPVLMLGVYMLFMAPKGIGLAYLVGWLLVMYLGMSILLLSHAAWGAVLATRYHERSKVFGVLAMVGVLGGLLVLVIGTVVHGTPAKPIQIVPLMGWVVIAAVPFCVGLVSWRTPEKVAQDVPGSRFNPRDYLALFTRPAMVRLLLAEMALTMGPGWMSELYLFFFRDSRGFNTGEASLLLVVYVVSGIFGAPATAWIATRFGKHRTLMVTTTAYAVGLSTVLLVPHGNVWGGVPIMLWCGFMAAGFGLMIRAMIADVGDEIRLEQGKERISLIYALLTLATKVAGALATLLSYFLLDHVGYHAAEGMKNTPQAITNLNIIFLAGPLFFVLAGGACFIGWKLNETRHNEIRATLDARDALYDETPLMESLTERAAMVVSPGEDVP